MTQDLAKPQPDPKRVVIRVDDRVRLFSAVLAATNYPDKSQAKRKHGTHAHARGTRRMVTDFNHHPAVHAMQVLLDQGIPLASMANYLLRLTWPHLENLDEVPRWVPPRWHEHLKHFAETTGLAQFWTNETSHWDTATRHLTESFAHIDLYKFFEPYVGPVVETLVFMPNLSYPSDQAIGVRLGGELVTIMPPPIAWGDSPPWPYKDDPALAYRAALSEYGTMLMSAYIRQHSDIVNALAERPLPIDEKYAALHNTWHDQFMGIFKAAMITIFLEDHVNSLEARSYVLHMQKMEGLGVLPGVVSVFRRYLEDFHAGRYKNFAEYLPNFTKHLRVAKTISAL